MEAFTWTDETVATLTRMCIEGHSYRAIATHLGTTRNACLGKADRIGLSSCARRRDSIYRLDDEHIPAIEIADRLLLQIDAVRAVLKVRDDRRRADALKKHLRRRNEAQKIARKEKAEQRRQEAAERQRAREAAKRAGTAPDAALQAALDRAEALAAGRSAIALLAANRLHLYDLKKAGYRAIDTECEGERDVLPVVIPRQLYAASYCGSPAASCAGL